MKITESANKAYDQMSQKQLAEQLSIYGTKYTADTLTWIWSDGPGVPIEHEDLKLPNNDELPDQGAMFIGEKGRMRECERLNLLLQGGDDIRMTVPEAGHRGSTTHVEVTATIAILEVHTRSGNRVWVALPRHTVEN